MTAKIELTRTHKVLIGAVVAGALIIASIGFAGSYAAVRELALKKGFGDFSYAFPVGIDAGICVLLALDLLLTWIRIPFPLLRQTAWLLTAATIAFNGASAWPDPLGVGMHAVIPVLFVVAVEAARHAIGRIADITADKHMEGVRLTRWLLSPVPTFLLWRRMKLWELRSYEATITLEQQRLVYQARLRAKYGRAWRRKAPVESLMPLRLARYGVPLHKTAPAGLAAANIPVPAELERIDEAAASGAMREEPPTSTPGRELERGAVGDDHSHGQDEVEPHEATGGHPEPHSVPVPQQSAPAPYEADVPAPAAVYNGKYEPVQEPVAARNDGRPAMVQARIDRAGWVQSTPEPFPDEVVQSPIGDQRGPLAPEPEPAPEGVNEVADEGPNEDESKVEAAVEPEPDLSGVDLLEYRYLRLPVEQRFPHRSASALARELCPGTGFTEGTARKYLRPIIDKHG
jgi:hypothetical protein